MSEAVAARRNLLCFIHYGPSSFSLRWWQAAEVEVRAGGYVREESGDGGRRKTMGDGLDARDVGGRCDRLCAYPVRRGFLGKAVIVREAGDTDIDKKLDAD